jgi:hypothetical protein
VFLFYCCTTFRRLPCDHEVTLMSRGQTGNTTPSSEVCRSAPRSMSVDIQSPSLGHQGKNQCETDNRALFHGTLTACREAGRRSKDATEVWVNRLNGKVRLAKYSSFHCFQVQVTFGSEHLKCYREREHLYCTVKCIAKLIIGRPPCS